MMQDQEWDPMLDGTDITQQIQAMLQASFPTGSEDFVYPLETPDCRKRTDQQSSPSPHPTQFTSLSLTVFSLLLDGSALPRSEESLLSTLAEQGFALIEPYTLVVLAVSMDLPHLPDIACTIDQVLQQYSSSCTIVSGGRVLTLFAVQPDFPHLNRALEDLLQILRRRYDPNCTLGVSRPFDRLSHCHLACLEAIDALRFSTGTAIRRYEDLLDARPKESKVSVDMEADLKRLLSGPSREALEQYLSAFLHGNSEDMEVLHLLTAIYTVLLCTLGTPETALLFQRCGLDHPLQMDRDQLIWRIRELCLLSYDQLARDSQGGVRQLCQQAIRIIQQQYRDEDLSLLSVCQTLHVSPNYLSANMKKYAGDTFINLLTRQRMEAALTLLREGDSSIGEIARCCGYRDQHYFSYCFKKYYGISPLKMRQSGCVPGEQNTSEEPH